MTCERSLLPVKVPPDRPEDDAIGAYLKQKAGLIVANKTINNARNCLHDQRTEYGGAKAEK